MNKISLSLIALAALTGVALANEKTDRDDHVFNSRTIIVDQFPAATVGGDAMSNSTTGFSAFDRQNMNAAEGDNGE